MVHPNSLTTISSAEFDRWQPARKVIAHDHARRFARLSREESQQDFALSWRSDSVEPVVRRCSQGELWLGVDQRAACITRDGRIAASIGLPSPILDITCLRDCIAVLCETELILFNTDHSIRKIHGLRGIPSSITECDGELFVTLDDGSREVVG